MLTKKKDSGEMSSEEIQAKMEVLQELMDMCKDKMGSSVKDGMDEMQKVTVAAPDKASLAAGLEKAQEITDGSSFTDDMVDKAEQEDNLTEDDAEKLAPSKSSMFSDKDDEDEDSMFAKRK